MEVLLCRYLIIPFSFIKIRKIYDGKQQHLTVTNLEPASAYTFTVSLDDLEMNCSRYIITKGRTNLLVNPSFESLGKPRHPQVDYGNHQFAGFWEPLMMPYDIVSDVSYEGRQSLHIFSQAQANKWGASQFVYLNQSSPKSVVISGILIYFNIKKLFFYSIQ